MQNFILNVLIGGAGSAISKGLSSVFGLFFTERMVATIIIGLAEQLSKSTKNTIDDKAVNVWKRQLVKSGILIK